MGSAPATGGATWLHRTQTTVPTSSGAAGTPSLGAPSVPTAAGGTFAIATTSNVLYCSGVTCPALPTTCTQIAQPSNECCAICLNNPCPPCGAIACSAGSHSETMPGECCPQCVINPPSQCDEGRSEYSTLRSQMIEKYSSIGCSNSSECTIVPENNACAWTCGAPLSMRMADTLKSNLDSTAAQFCPTCAAPPAVTCERTVPACVNGKCVTANPG